MSIRAILGNCLLPLKPEVESQIDSNTMNEKGLDFKKITANQGPGETVEFYDLIFDYVRRYNFPADVKARINFDLLSPADVIESKLKVYNMPAVHEINNPDSMLNNTMKLANKQVKSSVLFSSTFTNSTSEKQTHHLSTERRTTASCSLIIGKTMTKEGEMKLEIAPPGLMIQANGGFRKEITLDTEKQKNIEEEISWSLNTEIIVPAGCRTKAELVISEEKYDGHFRIDTIIEGTISVLTREKKTNSIVSPVIINDLQKVFTSRDGFYPIEGKSNAVRFVNEGKCSCQYGIAQKVVLTEEKL